MKTIILSDNNLKQIIAKIYLDGSLRLVQRWKKQRCQNEIFYLQPNSIKILKANLIKNRCNCHGDCNNCQYLPLGVCEGRE